MKIGFSALALATLAACATPPAVSDTPPPASQSVASADFTQMLNSLRASQGLGPLRQSKALTNAAIAHAADMERRNYFGHSSVGGPNGDDLVARAASAGCDLRTGAENIARGQDSELEVFVAWRDSPGHRRNLLGAKYTDFGLALVDDTWVMKISAGC
ncbi:CAP domain-containing protein [Yoonia sp.]|uniref:CAP domain-containing protein n=1 Tax=Yoonia sp. TaxID=2212373 RepID=UPI0023B3DC75